MYHLRGGDLKHLVSDYKSNRSFIITTSHELSPCYALRTMTNGHTQGPRVTNRTKTRMLRQMTRSSFGTAELSEDTEDGADLVFPCVNQRTDENGKQIYTNKQLCDPNMLYWSSSGSEPSSLD